MFKTLKATLAAALVTLGVIATQAHTANAFTAPAPDAITAAGSLATNVSCGGVDCDHPSQRGYTFYGRFKSERHYYGRSRYRSYRGEEYRRYRRRPRGYHRSERRSVDRAIRNLVGAIVDRRW
jgi:hypothetical protein